MIFSYRYFISFNVCPIRQLISLEHAYRLHFSHYCAKFPYVCCLLWETVLPQILFCFVLCCVTGISLSDFKCVSILTLRSLSVPIYALKSLPIFLELPCQHNRCHAICKIFMLSFSQICSDHMKDLS